MGQNSRLVQNWHAAMRVETCAAVFVALVMAAFGSWIAVMALDTEIPYDYIGGEIKPDPVREGGRVIVNWRIKVKRVCPGYVQRVLTDEATGNVVAAYDPTPTALTVRMGDIDLNKSFLLPDDLPPVVGYDAAVCFKCNKLQYIFPLCIKTPHLKFHVKPEGQ